MRPYYKTLARDLGSMLYLPALLALPTLVVALIANELFLLPGLAVMALVSIGLAQLLQRHGRGATDSFSTLPLVTAALAWLLIALLGTLPFYGAAWLGTELSPTTLAFRDPLNALFESMSGITSTGLTVTEDASTLPMTLQWWRSLSQWIGAVGVIVFALALVEPVEKSYELYSAEARTGTIGDNVQQTVRRIWGIYLLYTVLTILLYLLVGMPPWEAINHGLTGIGTGGFTITPNSFQGYDSIIKLATLLIIIMGAITFKAHYALLRHGDWRFVLKQSQIRSFGILLLTGTFVLILINQLLEPEVHLIDTVFQWVTALGTCGFSSVNLTTWNQPALLLLTSAMFMGGTAGSTVGGLKLNRVTWLVKALAWQLRKLWLPETDDLPYTFNGDTQNSEQVKEHIRSAAVLAFLWLTLVVLGTLFLLLLLAGERGLHEVLFEVTSALSNVGLSVGISSPDLHPLGRLVLIVLMWLGRLEILAVLVLFMAPLGMRLRRKNNRSATA